MKINFVFQLIFYLRKKQYIKFSFEILSPNILVTFSNINFNHGIIIRKGITCKKIPCYMRDSACRWFIVKKPKMFQSYVKHF